MARTKKKPTRTSKKAPRKRRTPSAKAETAPNVAEAPRAKGKRRPYQVDPVKKLVRTLKRVMGALGA